VLLEKASGKMRGQLWEIIIIGLNTGMARKVVPPA